MKNETIIFASVILLLLLLSGCTEMTRSEKNLCVSLSSKSYAYLPNCETESSCFEKVSTLFKTKLGYEEESELYEIKNHVARSWYFYNLSLKEQKNIQTYCKNADPIKAAGALNQAQDLISTSFLELDLGIKKSFNLISLEEKKLSKEEIDLLKEEKIYSNLIEFRQIISELNTGPTNSDTYVSYYMKKAESFAKSSAAKKFPTLVEKTPFWIENFSLINNTILKEIGIEQEAYFPFITNLFENIINQAEILFFKKQSILALQNFPIYEFMKLYSDLGGNNNSALKRFSDLINKTSDNQLELNKKISDLWKQNEEKLAETKELLKKIDNSEEFKELANKLLEKTITTDSNINKKSTEAINEFIKLKEKKSKANLTKGEELNTLKKLELNFNEINLLLNFKINGFEEKLINACKIESNKEIDITNNDNQIILLIEDIKYYSSRVKNTTGKESLLSCQELIIKKELLNKALTNTLLLQATQKDSIKECVVFLEKIFINEKLFELNLQFDELKKIEVTKENLNEFEEKCNLIKKQVENELQTNKDYLKLLEEYKKLQNNLKEFEEIAFQINENATFLLKEKYFKEAQLFEDYFKNNKIVFEKISNVKYSILEKITTLNQELNQMIEEKIIYFIEKNIVVSKLNSEIIQINKTNFSLMRLIITNPFREIKKEIYIKIDFDLNQIVSKDACVDSIIGKTINLIYLPTGKISIDFERTITINSEEKDSFIYVTNEESLLKRQIYLTPKIQVQKMLIQTNQPQKTTNTIVLVDSIETFFVNENNQTKFVVDNIKIDTQIDVFYYLTEAINLTKELIKTETTDIDETLIYKITAQNNFPKKLNANLFIVLPSTNTDIIVYSQDYTKKEIKKVQNKVIILNQEFLEKETKYYELWVKTNNALDYYKEGLEKQESFFIEHDYLQKAQTTKKIREENNLESIKRIFESNSEEIKQIELNEKNKTNLELTKQKLLEKIEELRKKQQELYDLGLTTEAEKIGTTIDSIINEQLDSDKAIAKAFDKLVNLYFSADNKLKSEVEKMWQNINNKTENSEILNKLKNSFFEKKQIFDEKFAFDPAETNKIFSHLQEDYSYFLEISKEVDKNNLIKQKELINKLNSDLDYCNTTLDLIEKELIENNSALIKAKFILPLTQSRIDKIRLLILEITNSNLTIEEKIQKLNPIKTEIWEAIEIMKKQAILAFNNAVDNKFQKEILVEGKKLIDENNYVDAYLMLFDSKNPMQNFLGFTTFLPIILIIIVAFVLKNKLGKKEKEDSEKKKKIIEEWEKI